ncbi:MAG TPA: tetratricopeptide repeat protein [Terriglobales bacterium]|nr:tetratricopeptide repeat protein [Terriglobales bacterium]
MTNRTISDETPSLGRARPLGSFAVTLLASLLMVAVSAAQSAPVASDSLSKTIQDGEHQLEDGRTTLNEQTLLAARNAFADCVHEDSKNARCYYDLARADYYLKSSRELQKDKKGAEHWLDQGITDVQQSIALNDRSADAHALLGDFYGQKISGMMSGMKYGPKANAETEHAFQLDPSNPQAFAVIGRKYLFAPSMFGGNIDKAIDSFRKATTLDPHYDEAFAWLSIAYRKKGNAQEAQKAIDDALRLNPRSVFAKRIQAGEAP